MDSLPVQLTLVEVIRALLCCAKSEEIQVFPLHLGVELKSKKKAYQYSQKVFYIRVSCNFEVNFKALLEGNKLLSELPYSYENEAHLSVQQLDAVNENVITQNILWLSEENSRVCINCQSSSSTTKLDIVECDSFVIHFRIIQSEEHMLLEGQQFCKFLYWMKFINPKIGLSFTMKISGAVCNTDFSYKTTTSLRNVTLINDASYLLWNSQSTPAGKVLCYGGNSVSMEYESHSLKTHLCISSLISFLPVWKEHSHQATFTGNCWLTVYGPEHIPLPLNSVGIDNFHSLINWSRFPLVMTRVKPSLKDCSQWENRMAVEIKDKSFLPKPSSVYNSFLLQISIIISCRNGCSPEFTTDLHTKLSNEKNIFIWPALKESLESAMMLFNEKRSDENNLKKISVLTKTVPLISKALCDIVSLSSCRKFRSEMKATIQAENPEDMKHFFTEKLWKLSNCQRPETGISQQICNEALQEDEDIPVIDSWEELPAFHTDGLSDEHQSTNTEITNQDEQLRLFTAQINSMDLQPQQGEPNQLLFDESFFEDIEAEFDSVPEFVNNTELNNRCEDPCPEQNENNAATDLTDSAWFSEVLLDVADWM